MPESLLPWLNDALEALQSAEPDPLDAHALHCAAHALYKDLLAWSVTSAVEPRAFTHLAGLVEALGKHVPPSARPASFCRQLITLAERVLSEQRKSTPT